MKTETNETLENEAQTMKDYTVGDKETNITLEAKPVKIVGTRKDEVGKSKNEKFVFVCKHPDREENIEISKATYLNGKTLKCIGTWVSLDQEGYLFKNSAVSKLITFNGASSLYGLVSKEVNTIEDENGYLSFKLF